MYDYLIVSWIVVPGRLKRPSVGSDACQPDSWQVRRPVNNTVLFYFYTDS